MKKLIALMLVLSLLFALSGCKLLDYKYASDYYEAGDYVTAYNIFIGLGDFGDSAEMAKICRQKADYTEAEALLAAGDYRAALPLYEGLAMYMDSPVKAVSCRYHIGLDCIEAHDYEEALTWLEPLGSYEDSIAQVKLAKWLWFYETIKNHPCITSVNNGSIILFATEDGGFAIDYNNTDNLLGISYTKSFHMTFSKDSREGVYTAVYDSNSNGQIREEVTGTLDISAFSATSKMPVATFSQTVIDPDGKETVSTTPSDALMMQGLLMEVQMLLTQCIPAFLEQTGLPLTLADIGFSSLA